MNANKANKIKNTAIKIVVFLAFLSLFAVGASKYFNHLPFGLKKPIVQLQRKGSDLWAYTILKDKERRESEEGVRALKALVKTNDGKALYYARKMLTVSNPNVSEGALLTIARVGKDSELNELIPLNVFENKENKMFIEKLLKALFLNSKSNIFLQKIINSKVLNETHEIQIFGVLYSRNKSNEEYRKKLDEALDSEDEELASAALLKLSQVVPEDEIVANYHISNIKNKGNGYFNSLAHLARFRPSWLNTNYKKLAKSGSDQQKKAVYSVFPIFCPNNLEEFLLDRFLEENSFEVKKQIFVAILTDTSKIENSKIDELLQDLKLRKSEKEELEGLLKRSKDSDLKICYQRRRN